MPFFFLVIAKVLADALRTFQRQGEPAKAEPLCASCSYAHVQYLAKGPCAISCGFGETLRPMKLDVLYCTDYRGRAQAVRPSIGFVRQIAPVE